MSRSLPGTGMRSRLAIAIFLAFIASPPSLAGQAEELLDSGQLRLRARVEPGAVYVGEKVELVVDVLTATWFLSAPRYPDTIALEDAIVLPPESFGVNFSERIDGQSYAGQTRKLIIFPARPGMFELPPVPIRVVVADSNARPTSELVLHTPSLRFEARLPEAARGLGLVVATPRLTARQEWDREATGVRAGDALTRTVTLTIEESVSMLLPELAFGAPEGVAAYPGRAEISDERGRGEMRGTRVTSVTYVLEREGAVTLPDVTVHWWDLGSDQLRSETLPGIQVEVLDNPELASGTAGMDDGVAVAETSTRRRPGWRGVLLALAVLAAIVAASRPVARLFSRLGSRARTASEAATFDRLRRAARGGDPGPTLTLLYAWLDRFAGEDAATIDAFAARAGDPELTRQLSGLVEAACGRGGGWSPETLIRSLARARASRSGLKGRALAPALGPLNPER